MVMFHGDQTDRFWRDLDGDVDHNCLNSGRTGG